MPVVGVSRLVGGVAMAVSVLAVHPATAQETRATRTLAAPLVSRMAASQAGDRLPILIQFESPPSVRSDVPNLQMRAAGALAPLDEVGSRPDVELGERFWVVPAAVAAATPAAIREIAELPGVRRVYLDEPIPVLLEPALSVRAQAGFTSQAMQTIGADVAWQAGITGQGTTVALFDTGVDITNAMLASRWRGRRTSIRASWFDPYSRASEPMDNIGHGTQVAAAAVGALPVGDTLIMPDGTRIAAASPIDVVTGAAPEAEWIAARVFEVFGGTAYTRRSVLLQAFQWALDPDGVPGTDDAPDVINNSWGIVPDSGNFDQCEDVIYDAIDAAEAAGIAVVFAAGNAGPAPSSVLAPASRDDPGLRYFAVGATTGTGDSVQVAEDSGRGPSPCNGGIKPEIAAPGTVPVVVAATANSVRLTGSVVRGTSFASPQVAGTIALLRQASPGITPRAAKEALVASATDLRPPGPDNDTGSGLLNVPRALLRVGSSLHRALPQIVSVEATEDSVFLTVTNRGSEVWSGGRLDVMRGDVRATSDVAALLPGTRTTVGLVTEAGPGSTAGRPGPELLHVTLFGLGGQTELVRSFYVVRSDAFGGFILRAGDLAAGANDFGRLGRVAAFQGFVWQGTEMLPSGSVFVSDPTRISDAIYVTVLDRPDLKTSDPSVDTDWAPVRLLTENDSATATLQYDDFESLTSLGLQVDARLEATDSSGVGTLELTLEVRNTGGVRLPVLYPGVFADWDLAGGESIEWSVGSAALVATPRAGAGVAMLGADVTAVATADVPLGTPGNFGFYEPDSGVLWGDLAEATKVQLARGGSTSGLPGDATATDRAAMLSVGPLDLAPGAARLIRFWLIAAPTVRAGTSRLDELRAQDPTPPGRGDTFEALPPFPNPFRVDQGSVTFPYTVPPSAAGQTLEFQIYDLAGRIILRQTIDIGPGGPTVVPRWDGRLAGGEQAAAGTYLFVFRRGSETRTGRLVLFR